MCLAVPSRSRSGSLTPASRRCAVAAHGYSAAATQHLTGVDSPRRRIQVLLRRLTFCVLLRVLISGIMADAASMSLDERAARFSPKVGGADRVTRPAAAWAETPVAPGIGGLERVFSADDCDLWVARGMFPMVPFVLSLPTTMTVHRDAAGSLTVFNALRLGPEAEEELLALGPVRRVVKLGQFHGAADAYYVKNPKFGTPECWTLSGGTTAYVLLCFSYVPAQCCSLQTWPLILCFYYALASLSTRRCATVAPE